MKHVKQTTVFITLSMLITKIYVLSLSLFFFKLNLS